MLFLWLGSKCPIVWNWFAVRKMAVMMFLFFNKHEDKTKAQMVKLHDDDDDDD